MFDHNGDQVEPSDVLDTEELAAYERSRNHSRPQRVPHPRLFPSIDADGDDVDGFAWGASPDGKPR